MPSYAPVAAFVRGLRVLRAISGAGRASIKDIHETTGLDKATIVRMVETLMHEGYVGAGSDGSYQVTGRVLQLSEGFERTAALAEHAGPVLSRFRSEIGWPSDIAICDGDAMIVVSSTRDARPMSFNRRVGFRAPILRTSLGRAYLAWCGEAERQRIVARLVETGAATGEQAVTAVLDAVRAQGFGTMDEDYSATEYAGTFWAMAVPIASGDKVHGALNIMLLTQAVTLEQARGSYLGPLRATAEQLGARFDAAGL